MSARDYPSTEHTPRRRQIHISHAAHAIEEEHDQRGNQWELDMKIRLLQGCHNYQPRHLVATAADLVFLPLRDAAMYDEDEGDVIPLDEIREVRDLSKGERAEGTWDNNGNINLESRT